MRRVPVDEEFGPPIATLSNSPIALFENGTIAKISVKDENENQLLSKQYRFYYENVSQVSQIKLNPRHEISPFVGTLMTYKSKLSITFILAVILALSYHFSINYSQLPLIVSISDPLLQIAFSLFVIISIVGFEYFIHDHFTKNTFQTRSLQINLLHRNDPKIILEGKSSAWRQYFDIHNGLTRFAIILSCIFIPESKDFSYDLVLFIQVLAFSNLMIYIVAFSFSPLVLSDYLSKRKEQKDFAKVRELEIEAFFSLTKNKMKKAREDAKLKVPKNTIEELISGDETSILEFKASVWTTYNPKTYQLIEEKKDKNLLLQDGIVKSVAGFLNTDGGTLLIGVKDKPLLRGNPVVGIENDYRFTKKKDRESFHHSLIQLLEDAFERKPTVLNFFIDISYPIFNDKQLCRIEVDPLPREEGGELFAKTKTYGDEAFFYRTSDTTTDASMISAIRYINKRFYRRTIDDEFEKSLE